MVLDRNTCRLRPNETIGFCQQAVAPYRRKPRGRGSQRPVNGDVGGGLGDEEIDIQFDWSSLDDITFCRKRDGS